MQNQMIFQSLGTFEACTAVLTFVLLLIAVNNLNGKQNSNCPSFEIRKISHHMHLQSSLRVEWNSANVANVLRAVVDVFVRFQSRKVFELFRTATEPVMNFRKNFQNFLPKAALIWISIGMNDLMLLECALRAERFAASWAEKRPFHVMNRTYMRLNVDRLRKSFLAVWTRVNHFLIVW